MAPRTLSTSVLLATAVAVVCPVQAFAEDSADPNAVLAFKKIHVDPPKDNVEGAFAPVVEGALKEFFGANPRFEQVSDRTKSDGLIQITITKQATSVELQAQLSVTETSEVFALDRTQIQTNADDSDIRRRIVGLVKTLMRRIPFAGSITGREGSSVTLDIGSLQGLKEGDTVRIARIDGLKRHPLLKQIVDVQLIPVGSVRLAQVEEGIAFGQVIEELPGEKIRRLQKITSVEHAPPPRAAEIDSKTKREGKFGIPESDSELGEVPHYGFVNLALHAAGFSSSSSYAGQTFSGSAFNPGFTLGGEVWFTSNIFADLYLGGSFMSYSQSGGTQVMQQGVTASTRTIGFNAGYRFLFSRSIYGPQLAFKGGYHSFRWQIPTSSPDLVTRTSYSGINLGVEGKLPIGHNGWGALVDLNFTLLPSVSQASEFMGSDGSAAVARVFAGGYYFFNTRLSVRAGLDFQTYSKDFDNTERGSTSQKNIGFSPSVQYYF